MTTIVLQTAFLAKNLPELAERELRYHFAEPDATLARIAHIMSDALATGCPSGRLFGEAQALAVAAHMLTHYAATPAVLSGGGYGLSLADLKRIDEYIHDNLNHGLTLHELARVLVMSPYHFARLFRLSMGMTPHHFILQERVHRARDLLRTGQMTVTQAALAVGFASPSHL